MFQDSNYNTVSGEGALNNCIIDDSCGWNTATGAYALYSNTTGGGNTATGYAALYNNQGGLQNTAQVTKLFIPTPAVS